MSPDGITLHAVCVAIGEEGLLIRGAPGAGKSSLARDLIDRAAASGRFGRLVADDRVRVSARSGRLVARPVPAIAGRMEVRGVGIVAVAHEPACVVGLVVDLRSDDPPRLPEAPALATDLCGVSLRRLELGPGAASVVWSVLARATAADPESRAATPKDGATARPSLV